MANFGMRGYCTYVVYKNEFHPLFIEFLKGMCAGCCSLDFNFYRKVVRESSTRLELYIHCESVVFIQECMYKSSSYLAKRIWP